MIRIWMVFLMLTAALCAALYEPFDDSRDREILASLDVDESFLHDPEFQTMKTNYAVYRQTMFLQTLSDAHLYQPMIKQAIADSGLPPALVYMAMAESSFKPRAFSSARAVGIWQFMPATAKRYGLRVDLYVDERRDPIKATKAAIQYLTTLRSEFDSWALAVMAYNCGEGRMRRAIREVGSDRLEDLLHVVPGKRRQALPHETRNYLRKVLAMATLAESQSLMLSSNTPHLLNRGSSYPLTAVEVGPGTTLQEVARATGERVETIRRLNPSLRYDFLPPHGQGHQVYIPYGKVAQFRQNFAGKSAGSTYIVHEVQSGENLGGIGRRYGVPYSMIQDFNSMRSTMIRPGQKLVVPVLRPEMDDEYVVQRGDSLSTIARKFNTSVEQLKNANNLQHSTIFAGDRLIIHR